MPEQASASVEEKPVVETEPIAEQPVEKPVEKKKRTRVSKPKKEVEQSD